MIQDIHPHTFSNNFIADAVIKDSDYMIHFKEGELLLKMNGEACAFPKRSELIGEHAKGLFLFTLNGQHCYLLWECQVPHATDFVYQEISYFKTITQPEMDWASSIAYQLKNWYEQNKFCGKCGSVTDEGNEERAIHCPACETTKYPNISPAIIVAILCDDKILLARGSHFPEGFFSLVAGYVDVGETIEDTVVREVQEEVGLKVKNIRYYQSQPWPFSGSMMIGFIAEADKGQTIKVDNKEILEAAWYTKDDLPNYPRERSIAGEMIEKFINNEL